MSSVDERLDLVDAVIYADLFDCAVTLDELWCYSRVRVTREGLLERLAEPAMREVVRKRNGFYCLVGREQLAELRASCQQRARRLRRRAGQVARWLQHAPFVRGILLTGSVAVDNADQDADVDLLLIVADQRLSQVFAQLGTLSRLLSRQLFCPNYYLSEAHLALRRQDHYVARELAQAQALAGNGADLQAANWWIKNHLPNASPCVSQRIRPLPGGMLVQRLLELPLRGRLGEWLEGKARNLALARLTVHYRAENMPVPKSVRDQFEAGIELRFHASSTVEGLVERYEARRAEVAETLRKHTPR